jgi:hypothetical protein
LGFSQAKKVAEAAEKKEALVEDMVTDPRKAAKNLEKVSFAKLSRLGAILHSLGIQFFAWP